MNSACINKHMSNLSTYCTGTKISLEKPFDFMNHTCSFKEMLIDFYSYLLQFKEKIF